MTLNRRSFLSLSGGLLFAGAGLTLAKARQRIVVAGAGLAGLSAAFELSKLGFDVTVVESRDRVGGRIATLKQPFLDGQFVELGGELIGDGYKRLLGYAKQFGVPFEDSPPDVTTGGSVANLTGGIASSAIFKEKFYSAGAILDPHPYALKGDEAKALPPTLLSQHLRQMALEVAGDPQRIGALDKLSLADALRARGVSDDLIRLMNISLNYQSIETVSAGSLVFEGQRRLGAGSKAVRIIDGNEEIPKALAENAKQSGVKFILQSKISRISDSPNSVKISFQNKNGKIETIEAERLVCTIPFSVLRKVDFSPRLPAAKMQAINELPYTAITKVYFQASRLEWDRRNIGSSIWTDTPLERIFAAAGRRGDAYGIFTAWIDGEGAGVADKMDDESRKVWATREFEKALPFMRGSIATTQTKSWANDAFARGAYSHFTRGQFIELQPALKAAVGTIHFAGEHTAEKAPGMEGALESAERVVAEILAAK